MSKYSELTKFIPVLGSDMPLEWAEEDGIVRAEYPEVVFRFMDALEGFLSKHEGEEEDEGVKLARRLLKAYELEETCPGTLAGFIMNGTVADWLTGLEKRGGSRRK
jgi:hypothetical protein